LHSSDHPDQIELDGYTMSPVQERARESPARKPLARRHTRSLPQMARKPSPNVWGGRGLILPGSTVRPGEYQPEPSPQGDDSHHFVLPPLNRPNCGGRGEAFKLRAAHKDTRRPAGAESISFHRQQVLRSAEGHADRISHDTQQQEQAGSIPRGRG
jgi:hypothetical protein